MAGNQKELKVISTAKNPKNPYSKDIITDPRGQWAHPGEITKIPSGNITMQGVPYPVLGVDDLGNQQLMHPGLDYTFPGQSVIEYPQMPIARNGGDTRPENLKGMNFPYRIKDSVRRDQQIKDFYWNLLSENKNDGYAEQNIKSLNPFYGTDRFEKLTGQSGPDPDQYYGFDYNDIDTNKLNSWKQDYYKKQLGGGTGGWMDKYQDGGQSDNRSVAQMWQETTGLPWSAAKAMGITDGSYESNMKVREGLRQGHFDNVAQDNSYMVERPVHRRAPQQEQPRVAPVSHTSKPQPISHMIAAPVNKIPVQHALSPIYAPHPQPHLPPTVAAPVQAPVSKKPIYAPVPVPRVSVPPTVAAPVIQTPHVSTPVYIPAPVKVKPTVPAVGHATPISKPAPAPRVEPTEPTVSTPPIWLPPHLNQPPHIALPGVINVPKPVQKPINKHVPLPNINEPGVGPYLQNAGLHTPWENNEPHQVPVSKVPVNKAPDKTLKKGASDKVKVVTQNENLDDKSFLGPLFGNAPEWSTMGMKKGKPYDEEEWVKSHMPNHGVYVDKRTNTAYYIGSNNETGSFPVLTGKNVDLNSNPYTVEYLENHPEARNTPVGNYTLETPEINNRYVKFITLNDDESPGSYYNYIMKDYKGKIRDLTPVAGYGYKAPVSKSLAFHRLYSNNTNNPNDPEYLRRLNLLNNPNADQRCGSYGCTNATDESYDTINNLFPEKTPYVVMDSKNLNDLAKLNYLKSRMKSPVKQFGGGLDEFASGGAISLEKAQAFLEDGSIYGHPLSQAQEDYFQSIVDADDDNDSSSNDTDEDEMRYGGLKRRKRTTTNPMAGINRLMLPNEQYHTPKGRLFVPPHFQSGGTVSDLWEEHTGTPWSEAKKQGLTDGSYEANMKVRDMLMNSEIKKPQPIAKPKSPYGALPMKYNNSSETVNHGNSGVNKYNAGVAAQQIKHNIDNTSDEKFQQIYGTSKHRMKYDTDPKYKAQIDKEAAAADSKIYQTPNIDPNAMFMLPSHMSGQGAQDMQEFHKNIIGSALPIPGVEAVGKLPGTLDLVKGIPIALRDAKFRNKLTIGTKDAKQTFTNSYDWKKAFDAERASGVERPLLKKEINFLNQEIKDRGILEIDRRHPLDPRQPITKRGLLPEDYNLAKAKKDFIPNLIKGDVRSQYTMGPGRENAFNQYLGIPTKDNMYRIHPESFTKGNDIIYTVPHNKLKELEKINASGQHASIAPSKESFDVLSIAKESLSNNTKNFHNRAYDALHNAGWSKKQLGPKKNFTYDIEDPNWGADAAEGARSKIKNDVGYISDYDSYTNAHGNAYWENKQLPSGEQSWKMKDIWDINPFSRMKDKPKWIQKLDVAPIMGAKNFDVNLDYIINKAGKLKPLVPKKLGGKTGGWLDKYK